MKTNRFKTHLRKLKEQKIEVLEGTVLTSIQGGTCTKCKPNSSGGTNCSNYRQSIHEFERED